MRVDLIKEGEKKRKRYLKRNKLSLVPLLTADNNRRYMHNLIFFQNRYMLLHPYFKQDAESKGNDQSCGSGMFIPDPDFYPSWIRSRQQHQKNKGKFFCPTIFLAKKIIKFDNFILEQGKKIIFSKNTKIYCTFIPKICH